jgi:hypothetical protein
MNKNFLMVAAVSIFLVLACGFLFWQDKIEGRSQGQKNGSSQGQDQEGKNNSQFKSVINQFKNPDLLLPDLIILEPEDLYIQTNGNKKLLRFSTRFANTGDGPLELKGVSDPEKEVVLALQVAYDKNGSSDNLPVGEFILHPEHDHWHFNNITLLELWTLNNDNSLNKVLATTNKTSFCIQDWEVYEPEQDRAVADPAYEICDDNVQGISEGWLDYYSAETEGQELDITSVPDGQYAVRLTIDPDNLIIEANEDNNQNTVNVEINGSEIVKVSHRGQDNSN